MCLWPLIHLKICLNVKLRSVAIAGSKGSTSCDALLGAPASVRRLLLW